MNSSAFQQTINNDIVLGSSAIFKAAATGNLVFGGAIDTNGKTLGAQAFTTGILKLNGTVSGSGGIQVNGSSSGIIELNNSNTYSGGTVLFAGTTKAGTSGAIGNGTLSLGLNNTNLAPTFLTNGAITIANSIVLASNSAGSPVYTIGGATADTSTYSGAITMGTSGGGSTAEGLRVTAASGGRVNFTGNLSRGSFTGTKDVVTKIGSGVVALSGGNNTYQGATLVNAGTLLINGTLDNTGANVSVASGATLGGNGTIYRSGSLAAGGILSAGDMSGSTSLAGTLAFGSGGATSGLTMLGTSVLKFDLQQGNFTVGGGINDLVTVGGNLTLDGTLQVTELGGSLTNGTYRLFNYTGTLTDNTLTIDAAFLAAHAGSTIDTSVANQINLLVVPEPATWVLLACGLTAVVVLRRRRA